MPSEYHSSAIDIISNSTRFALSCLIFGNITSIPSNTDTRKHGSVTCLECHYCIGCPCHFLYHKFRLQPDDGGLQEHVLWYSAMFNSLPSNFQTDIGLQEHFVRVIPRGYAMTSQTNLQRTVAVQHLAARQTLTGAQPRWDMHLVIIAMSTHLRPQLLGMGGTGGSIDAFLLWKTADREEQSALSIEGFVKATPATSTSGLLMHGIFHSAKVRLQYSIFIVYALATTGPVLGQCSSDPNEQRGPGGAKRFMSRDFVNNTSNNVYHTASGAEIIVPSGAQINQTVWTVVPNNKTLYDQQVETHINKSEDESENEDEDEDEDEDEYGYMLDNLKLIPDVIVGKS